VSGDGERSRMHDLKKYFTGKIQQENTRQKKLFWKDLDVGADS
jgi:hypothetical protein